MRNRENAFTLLEIMLVVAIIGVLLGTAIYKLSGNLEVGRSVAVRSDVQTIKVQLKSYEAMNGFLPTTEQGLRALIDPPQTDPRPERWIRMLDKVPKDPWGSEYIYFSPGRRNPGGYDLSSAGPDRKADTADDNWGE